MGSLCEYVVSGKVGKASVLLATWAAGPLRPLRVVLSSLDGMTWAVFSSSSARLLRCWLRLGGPSGTRRDFCLVCPGTLAAASQSVLVADSWFPFLLGVAADFEVAWWKVRVQIVNLCQPLWPTGCRWQKGGETPLVPLFGRVMRFLSRFWCLSLWRPGCVFRIR